MREYHYRKFNTEGERDYFIKQITQSPYYIGHYTYSREGHVNCPVQYMVGLTLGNFVPNTTPHEGVHIPMPLSATEEEGEHGS
jgi:hypothetical protein